jgi:hypothetical protein
VAAGEDAPPVAAGPGGEAWLGAQDPCPATACRAAAARAARWSSGSEPSHPNSCSARECLRQPLGLLGPWRTRRGARSLGSGAAMARSCASPSPFGRARAIVARFRMAGRRLPVIQEPSGEDAAAASRPAWQWVLIGSGLLVTIWTPSVAVLLALGRKLQAARAGSPPLGAGAAASLVAASFAGAAVAAGYLVARFGRQTRPRHAAAAGLLAALEIWMLALLGGAFGSSLVAITAFLSLAALGSGFCGLGGWLGRPRK